MRRREEGFTLIEILVVITIIAALVGMVTLVIPKGQEAKNRVECMNNLRQVGGLLATMKAGKGFKPYLGAAFVLQVADQVNDSDLKVFICPGEPANYDDVRPDLSDATFAEMFRKEMDLKAGKVEDRYTSYAGPNWRDYPDKKSGAGSRETRFWACDKCRNGQPHHDGIVVLHDTSKVDFIKVEELEGHTKDAEEIVVGETSPDNRLKKMLFFPNQ